MKNQGLFCRKISSLKGVRDESGAALNTTMPVKKRKDVAYDEKTTYAVNNIVKIPVKDYIS